MSEDQATSKEKPRVRRRAVWPLLFLFLLVVVVAYLLRERVRPPEEAAEGAAATDQETDYTRSAVLYYAAESGDDLVAERRDLAVGGSERETFAARLVLELARAPETAGAYAALPPETAVRSVFFDDLGDLYVDFDGAGLSDWAWGTASEILAIRSIVRTLCGSFPDVLRVGFLIDGKGVETFAGHIDASHPFEASEWR